VSEALASRAVILFVGKTQRPMQLLDHRADLMLWRTVRENLGVRRFAKLHAQRQTS